jgi:serine/threonine protein kinase
MNLKLIDIDACVNVEESEYVCSKYSTGFLPPEMIHMCAHCCTTPDGSDVLKAYPKNSSRSCQCADVCALTATYSIDLWSLGAVLFNLCADKTLFHCDGQDNISQMDMCALYKVLTCSAVIIIH